ncbi:cupin domain-containing protein [Amycolatopsis samaneae]|uniref:LuxR family transcriptional regulator n=1 Tax=Amycolatopsis samaneae TaxID=664691 RepID=A0ABW5GX84_9PSEU
MTDRPTVTSPGTLAPDLLAEARRHGSRRAARTLVSLPSLRATLIALAAGAELAEHDAPHAATLQMLLGTVRLHTRDEEWCLDSGQLAVIPLERHGVTAATDTVFLLSVVLP